MNNWPEMKSKRQSLQRTDKSAHFRAINDQFDNYLSDSGFKSNCYQDKRKSNEKLGTQKIEVPHMLSFVGGAFTVQLYKNAVNLKEKNASLNLKEISCNFFFCFRNHQHFKMYH